MVDRLLRSRVIGRPSTPVVSIALLPLGPEPRVQRFGELFERALARLAGSARQIDSVAATAAVGDELEGARLAAWCSDLEAENEVVVYHADPEPTTWTRSVHPPGRPAAARRGRDHVTGPAPRRAGRGARAARSRHSRTELVLVHPAWTEDPRGTHRWLAPRTLDRHHHVRVDRPAGRRPGRPARAQPGDRRRVQRWRRAGHRRARRAARAARGERPDRRRRRHEHRLDHRRRDVVRGWTSTRSPTC